MNRVPHVIAIVLGLILVGVLATEKQRIESKLIGVTAECNNGKFTDAKRGPGVCAANGGVKRWIEKEKQ